MHTQFWKSDYTLHHRAAYCFGVHTTSTRTAKQENGNDENLKGYYLSDGSTFISSNGGEYLNISPVWDWSMIPGVTAPYLKELPIRKAWGFNFGTTTFSGGVSDSLYGAAALDFNDYNTRIRKAWFFFDDEVVCLGAGLSSTAGENIYTTVNQCLQQGKVRTSGGKQLQWLTHDGISYYFPAADARYSTEKQTGDWYSINKNGTKETQEKEVFKLWIDHGKQPADKGYVYYVIPGKNMDQYDTKAVRVLQNSADIQAVLHTKLNILQVVFYKAGTFKNGDISITVDRGCVLMVRDNVLSIADPAQSELPVQVVLQQQRINCVLPKGPYAGAQRSSI
ncbi:polysaccharide lyase beta-sandwich domain-containing protein [Chitinophaga sedimenti]|uniref:polysaccharide lyase family 8 super-sandwich domain-containing protein n=1 Tax=Chitinophaga sedimenti TaxID=2033606 RepID=UPI0020042F09|nr:polysaccharide lyase family 8 super-sandwich domain-containing protein [Chitinophaga sedimenti]MCK7557753.1 polysaccharide lyase beta-sandwich domain-containing protein [Chitinophaga sedimenti]